MKKSEAEQFIIDHFRKEIQKETRQHMEQECLELIGWLLAFQNRHPEIRAAYGQDLHQCVRSKLAPYIGQYAL